MVSHIASSQEANGFRNHPQCRRHSRGVMSPQLSKGSTHSRIVALNKRKRCMAAWGNGTQVIFLHPSPSRKPLKESLSHLGTAQIKRRALPPLDTGDKSCSHPYSQHSTSDDIVRCSSGLVLPSYKVDRLPNWANKYFIYSCPRFYHHSGSKNWQGSFGCQKKEGNQKGNKIKPKWTCAVPFASGYLSLFAKGNQRGKLAPAAPRLSSSSSAFSCVVKPSLGHASQGA